MKIIYRLAIGLLLVSFWGQPACHPTSTETSRAQTQSLIVGLPKSPLTLDPRYNIDAASYRITQVVFNGLVKKDPQMNLIPDAAASWRLADERTWVFRLKQGIKFHNGREMTAEDAAFTFRSILDPESGSPKRQAFSMIDRIEAPDRYTVVFHTREPFAPLLTSLTLGIVPAPEAEAAGEDFAVRPIGSGPFKIVTNAADRYVRLAAFEDYFRGAPKIKNLTFRIVPDDTTRYLELIKGNLDLVENAVDPDMVPVIEKNPEFQVIKEPGSNYAYLAFNLQDPVLRNQAVRRAIAHALNIRELILFLLRGQARPATGILPPSHWTYEGGVSRYEFDPAQAERLLDQAGFPRKENGFRFTLTYKTTLSDLARRKGEIIQAQLKNVGIKLDIRGFDWGTLFADIRSGNFQIYSLEWVGVSEPDIYHYVFSSKSLPPDGANRGHYLNAELDRLIEAGRRTMDLEARRAIYAEIQKIAARDLPYVSLWHPHNVVILKKGLTGFVPYPDGDLSALADMAWAETRD